MDLNQNKDFRRILFYHWTNISLSVFLTIIFCKSLIIFLISMVYRFRKFIYSCKDKLDCKMKYISLLFIVPLYNHSLFFYIICKHQCYRARTNRTAKWNLFTLYVFIVHFYNYCEFNWKHVPLFFYNHYFYSIICRIKLYYIYWSDCNKANLFHQDVPYVFMMYSGTARGR